MAQCVPVHVGMIEVGSKWCPVHNESEHQELQRDFLSEDGAG